MRKNQTHPDIQQKIERKNRENRAATGKPVCGDPVRGEMRTLKAMQSYSPGHPVTKTKWYLGASAFQA
jgi:hypothetical protein